MPLRDALGRTFDFARPPQRVVSLVPSLTETLFDLGVGDTVVGITDFCIFPPDLERLRLGGTKNPRIPAIQALAPDLVHVNLEENLRRHAAAIGEFAPVFASEPKSLEDVAQLIKTLGAIHGADKRAEELIAELREEIARSPRKSFTFACAIWKNPWMWCGGDTYVSRLVECFGGRNVLHERERYPEAALEGILAMKPSIVFLPDEPYIFTTQDAESIRGPRVIGTLSGTSIHLAWQQDEARSAAPPRSSLTLDVYGISA